MYLYAILNVDALINTIGRPLQFVENANIFTCWLMGVYLKTLSASQLNIVTFLMLKAVKIFLGSVTV